MDKFQKLIANHAKYSDAVRQLKEQGCREAMMCKGIDPRTQELIIGSNKQPFWSLKNTSGAISCIQNAIEINKDDCEEESSYHSSGPLFSETWGHLVSEGKVCQHCIRVRELKAERVAMVRKLGATRAAITMVGRKMNEGGEK